MRFLFLGNPGKGKSTLINCFIGEHRFESGISIGTGLTRGLQEEYIGGDVFMDTPGMDDPTLREESANAITQALKMGGKFKVIFVVCLEAGRFHSYDAAQIKLVLESAPSIKWYGIVLNKLSQTVYDMLGNEDNMLKLLVTLGTNSAPKPYPFRQKFVPELHEANNAVVSLPGFNEFISELPTAYIQGHEVKDIPCGPEFSEKGADYDRLLNMLLKDRMLMEIEVGLLRAAFQKLMKEKKALQDRTPCTLI